MVLPTSAEVLYMKEHIHESLVPQIIAVNVACMVLALIAILLRIISRRIIGARMKTDDWTIIAALACPSMHPRKAEVADFFITGPILHLLRWLLR